MVLGLLKILMPDLDALDERSLFDGASMDQRGHTTPLGGCKGDAG